MDKCTNALTGQFLQGNVSLMHLTNEETQFMSWRRSAIKEVNDWSLYARLGTHWNSSLRIRVPISMSCKAIMEVRPDFPSILTTL